MWMEQKCLYTQERGIFVFLTDKSQWGIGGVHVTHGYDLATPGSACVIETRVAFSDPTTLFIDFTHISVKWVISKAAKLRANHCLCLLRTSVSCCKWSVLLSEYILKSKFNKTYLKLEESIYCKVNCSLQRSCNTTSSPAEVTNTKEEKSDLKTLQRSEKKTVAWRWCWYILYSPLEIRLCCRLSTKNRVKSDVCFLWVSHW